MAKEDKKKKRLLLILTAIAVASLSFFLYISYAPSSKAKSFEECSLLFESKKYDACVTCLNEYIKTNSEPEAYRMRGMSYLHTEQYENAAKDFTEFLNKNKTNREIYLPAGTHLREDGQSKGGGGRFQEGLRFRSR